ncbi:MAG: TIGR03564 family F420-dependent LLM class oxidoreductase [Proteobacteria bacterium]|nr:TIGR03564 family F420-dependent LLM class oxidoreductase [Pseudomonadota bacterium]
MKIGINGTGLVQKGSVAAVVDHASIAAADGFAHYWLAEHPTGGFDALTVLTAVGQAVPNIELGTAIVPTFPRHPVVLAGQARTSADIVGPRLTLGIGLSHEVMLAQLGIGFEKPIRHLREYLSILMPLLREGRVDYQGETLSCTATLFGVPQGSIPVVVAALGPQALSVCGKLADGTTLAWVGPKTIAEHIVPRLSEAAAKAGRKAPRVISTLPVCVTQQPDVIRGAISKGLSMYGQLPSYRAMFDREGVAGPADIAIVGSRAEVCDAIEGLAAAGVTDFAASEFCLSPAEREETRDALQSLVAA